MALVSCLYLPADKKYYKKIVNFGHAIPFSTSRCKMEGCERCPLSPSIEWHRSHVSILLLTKVITKGKYIFDMQFPFLPVGVKLKVVKDVHCPPLLMDTGLMSIGPLTKKLLQKHRPVSYSKKRRKLALSPRSLTERSAESELSRLVTLFRFFWGKLISSYCSLNVSRISKNKTNLTPLAKRNSQTHPCLHRKNNGKAAWSNKKPVKNYYCMSNISCLHQCDRLKMAVWMM